MYQMVIEVLKEMELQKSKENGTSYGELCGGFSLTDEGTFTTRRKGRTKNSVRHT